MKKVISIFLSVILMVGSLAGCGAAPSEVPGSGTQSARTEEASAHLRIVTTIFPAYDWVKTILGDRAGQAEVTMLLDNGVDPHSFQPGADDILKLSTCDLFIYVGGESDAWVKDALAGAVNKNMTAISLLEVLGDRVKTEETVEGMEAEHAHDDTHEDAHDDAHAHADSEDGADEAEADEHVWLSLRNAAILCGAVADALKQLDSAGAETYQANADAYREQLAALDTAYQETADQASLRTLLFGDRFPFRYLTDDYGLDYYAAFAGCSAETEASFETIVFLADKTDALGLPVILTIEGRDHRIAETIRDNTKTKDQQILTLDSMQSVTSQEAAGGASYLSIMKSNLEVLKKALKCKS